MSVPPVFRSPQAFRAAFVESLVPLIAADGLGTFILALGNAAFDPHIHHLLAPRLQQRFGELRERCRAALRSGRPLADAPDDLLVFLKLIAIGIEDLPTSSFRRAGPWELQFNPLRSLRPARASADAVHTLQAPFNAQGFHFDKAFLRREVFWEGELLGQRGRLLYNKFPFVDLHALWVPEPEAARPQLLDEGAHADAWRLAAALGDALPGLGLGYNAFGACASVNHLHFQWFVRPEPLPIEDDGWEHNGGGRPYPLPCLRFTDLYEAWAAIADLHAAACTYNLLYRPGLAYLVPRAFQGAGLHSPWTGGFAWHEVAGAVTTFHFDDFQRLDAHAIEDELRRLQPSA